MSNFNPNSKTLAPQEWRILAAKNVIKEADSASRDFVISALLGLVAAGLTGMMPVGVAVVGCGIMRGWRKNNLMDKRLRAIQIGCAAPFLDDSQLRRFTQQTGLDEVLKQIQWAIDEDIDTLPSAEDFYEIHGAALALPEGKSDAIDVQSTAVAETIGNTTRLGAVEVAAAAVEVAQPENAATGHKSLLDVVAENPKSSFFSAPARTGKGVTIAACIRMVQNRVKAGTLTKVTFWAITPKQDPQENWYWETCDKFFNPDIENGDRALAARGIYDFITAFTALPRTPQSPTILIVDELTRLVGLLKGIKMEAVDPELFAGDSKTFGDWLVDKLIYSASMSQSVGFYVWVATPSSAVGSRGFTKGDIDSLNIYTLATKDNLKFADGGSAAFSAPRTDANHPVFTRGFVAGYCHQNKRWYSVPDLTKQIEGRASLPTCLNNTWVPDSMQGETAPVATAIASKDEAQSTDEDDGKINLEKPSLPRSELLLIAAELAEWISQHSDIDRKDWCSRWNAHKRGFSRPQFRYLLTLIED